MSHGTVSATFHLTHDCNLRCVYCYTGLKFGAGMSPEVADRGVDFAIAEARGSNAEHLEIVFFGGEPLLRRDILYRVADRATAAAGGGLRVSFKMSTNGVLLSEETVRELARRRVYVSISLDGDPEVQDRQRPDAAGHGSAERLNGAIDRLLAWNPCAHVTCVITPDSAGRADASVRWLFERGFAYVSTALDWSAPWTAEDLESLGDAYRRLADWYVARTTAGEKFYLSCFDERIRSRTKGPLGKDERCEIGARQFSIAPSGRLYPCVQFVGEDRDHGFAIGDLEHGFDQARRRALGCGSEAEKEECTGCALQPRCASWCACINLQTSGRIDRVGALVCEHERLLLPIADEAANRLWQKRDPHFLHKHYNPAWPVLDFAERVVLRERPTPIGEESARP